MAATSTTKAEIVAASESTKEVIWHISIFKIPENF